MLGVRLPSMLALGVLGLLGIVALFPSAFAPHDPTLVDLGNQLLPPSLNHPLGTDQFGRCVFSRLVFGARTSLGAGLAVLVVTVAIGGLVAATATLGSHAVRLVSLRLLELGLSLPTLVVAIAVVGILGPGLLNAMVAVALTTWANPARLFRGLILSEAGAEHVLAARALGATPLRVFRRHVLPGIAGRAAVVASLYLGRIMLAFSGLSFLGLGPQPPTPEWGALLNEGRSLFFSTPTLMLWPGLAIVLTVGACNLLADDLAATLDERL